MREVGKKTRSGLLRSVPFAAAGASRPQAGHGCPRKINQQLSVAGCAQEFDRLAIGSAVFEGVVERIHALHALAEAFHQRFQLFGAFFNAGIKLAFHVLGAPESRVPDFRGKRALIVSPFVSDDGLTLIRRSVRISSFASEKPGDTLGSSDMDERKKIVEHTIALVRLGRGAR